MKRPVLATILLSVLALAGCDSEKLGKTLPGYRYRLTAQVQTPEGLKTGSSVIEVQWTTPGKIFGSQGSASYRLKGEAVAVDLPKGQTLFILLSTPWSYDWAAQALGNTGILKTMVSAEGADPGVHPLPRTIMLGPDKLDNYPYFVRFRDPRDPASIERVDPDALAKTFGPGTTLKALTVQLTSDPVTHGIYARLPWLKTQQGSLVKYPPRTPIKDIPEEKGLTEGAFIRGDSQ